MPWWFIRLLNCTTDILSAFALPYARETITWMEMGSIGPVKNYLEPQQYLASDWQAPLDFSSESVKKFIIFSGTLKRRESVSQKNNVKMDFSSACVFSCCFALESSAEQTCLSNPRALREQGDVGEWWTVQLF